MWISVLIVLLVALLLLQLLSIELKLVKSAKSDRVIIEERILNQNRLTVSEDEKRKRITKDKTTQLIQNELCITTAKLLITGHSPEEEEITLCNITSSDWRRVAYINMTDPEAECPSGLNEVSNSTTGQRACGRSVDEKYPKKNKRSSSVTFPVNTTYSQVCGIVRGYQYGTMDAFQETTGETVDQTYVDGLSITRGISRQHLWTLAVGITKLIIVITIVQEIKVLLIVIMFLNL